MFSCSKFFSKFDKLPTIAYFPDQWMVEGTKSLQKVRMLATLCPWQLAEHTATSCQKGTSGRHFYTEQITDLVIEPKIF
jgi:hypothetical protein